MRKAIWLPGIASGASFSNPHDGVMRGLPAACRQREVMLAWIAPLNCTSVAMRSNKVARTLGLGRGRLRFAAESLSEILTGSLRPRLCRQTEAAVEDQSP